MKKMMMIVAAVMMCVMGKAEEADSAKVMRPQFEMEYAGELQTDFKEVKMANLLQLRASVPVSRKLTVEVASVSAVTTDEMPLAAVLHGYSNIDAFNIPFALSVAGVTWQIDDNQTLFGGIRRMDEDYFCSDVLSLFTGSHCGGFPTIANNYPGAAYPLAAVGVHYAYEREAWKWQASLYNGVGGYKFTGAENVFRFCPKSDGVHFLTQAEYSRGGSNYFLGGSVHWSQWAGDGTQKARPVIWGYAEQKVTDRMKVLGSVSHSFAGDDFCRWYGNVGGMYSLKGADVGVLGCYTNDSGVDEWAVELTGSIPLTDKVALQPAMHIITTEGETNCVGLMRVTVGL